ncbi:MAG: tRNA (adenosine(37)-N6)-threonylcarbamoyltransferase complex ATPase subunit type 1 TsaE [Nitrospinae bacterium]|nr:tRNA (adenosine(37)-N6)-threonylcarbamoyltransferase complex ATPase subunit type 1 TsaE [Nitrospinota bacterium]
MNRHLNFKTNGEQETEAVGAGIAPLLKEGDIVCLGGDLGAGKTCFVRGVLSALQENGADKVKSPTYAILNIYNGNPNVYHYDFYRIDDVKDVYALGLDDYWGRGICMVEWPKNFCYSLPGRKIDVIIKRISELEREIRISWPDEQ